MTEYLFIPIGGWCGVCQATRPLSSNENLLERDLTIIDNLHHFKTDIF